MRALDFLEILYDALRSEIGVVVETEDTEKLRAKLYAIRQSRIADDPLLGDLSFVLDPTQPKTRLWVLRSKRRPTDE